MRTHCIWGSGLESKYQWDHVRLIRRVSGNLPVLTQYRKGLTANGENYVVGKTQFNQPGWPLVAERACGGSIHRSVPTTGRPDHIGPGPGRVERYDGIGVERVHAQ